MLVFNRWWALIRISLRWQLSVLCSAEETRGKSVWYHFLTFPKIVSDSQQRIALLYKSSSNQKQSPIMLPDNFEPQNFSSSTQDCHLSSATFQPRFIISTEDYITLLTYCSLSSILNSRMGDKLKEKMATWKQQINSHNMHSFILKHTILYTVQHKQHTAPLKPLTRWFNS